MHEKYGFATRDIRDRRIRRFIDGQRLVLYSNTRVLFKMAANWLPCAWRNSRNSNAKTTAAENLWIFYELTTIFAKIKCMYLWFYY